MRDKCQVPNSDPHGFEYIISNLEFSFFWIMFDDFWSYSMYFSWKYEESKTRNFLRFISPAEFLEKLGYEFSFDQKTWIDFVVKRTTFSIFGQCNPYHQSTYRFPPLHPISAPDEKPISASDFCIRFLHPTENRLEFVLCGEYLLAQNWMPWISKRLVPKSERRHVFI